MNKLLIILLLFVMVSTGCKKKFCGVISAISTEVSPANGEPLYKIYLESGEIVPMKSRGGLQVGQSYCND